jgi:hypothetical protein
MQERADRGDEERRGDVVAIKKFEDARESFLRSEVGGGESGRRGLS